MCQTWMSLETRNEQVQKFPTLTLAPEYFAATRAFTARKLSGYVYRVWKRRQIDMM